MLRAFAVPQGHGMAMHGARVMRHRITKPVADVVPGYLNVAKMEKRTEPQIKASADWTEPQR